MKVWHSLKWISLSTTLSILLLTGTSCSWVHPKPLEMRFCPVKVLYNADGTENVTHWAVERVCLLALQQRLDAAYGQ